MTLRSLWRHKIRSFLTAFGVTLAIAAIVSLGSISEGIDEMVQEQMKLVSDFVAVAEKGTTSGAMTGQGISSKVSTEIIDEIMQIDGVEKVSRRTVMVDPATNVFIAGIDLDLLEMFNLENMEFAEGGWPETGEFEIALGYQMAESAELGPGDEIVLREDTYVVTGVLEEMKNFLDYAAISSHDSIAETYDLGDYTMTLVVSSSDVRESERIANEIEERFDDVEAMTATDAMETAKEMVNQIRVMTLAIGVVASFVATIGIINTMMMVVSGRKREFGIMKALGAERATILSMVVLDGIVLAVIGGIMGLFLGFAGAEALNHAMPMPMAKITPALAGLSFLYGIGISIVASLYPAYQALNVDPVEAMRRE